MVAISTLLTVALTQLAITASAGSCKTFVHYCGSNLKHKGWTDAEIQGAVLRDEWNHGQFPALNQINKSTFKCAGQGKSLVWMHECANGCVDAGPGRDDYCA
ncbi:hypothetical protein CC86DRAFT_452512 [Ophiobolus disseminans]|uniref:Uncharacterized protein n=1 Tax=Ophiobolus disseminans TaxID=1469910 RepID=A0A6A7AFJ4_9PLEO|nr:hypothetical protein CC86DRAFT_452512 [Ophiobolus disseminans]